MNIFGSEMVSTNLRKLSDEEIEIICQEIEKQTAVLNYYTNLYKLFQYIEVGKGNEYYGLIGDALAESICKLLSLKIAIPKNKSIKDISEEDEKFRCKIMREALNKTPKDIVQFSKDPANIISLKESVKNKKLQSALEKYQTAITEIYAIKALIEGTIYRVINESYPSIASKLEKFAQLSSLGKVIYVSKSNDPYLWIDKIIISSLARKCERHELAEEQFNNFLSEHINDLLGIVRDYPNILAGKRIKEFIIDLYCAEETKQITKDSYKAFLDKEIGDRYKAILGRVIDNAGISSMLTFLYIFFSSEPFTDFNYGELHKIAIRSIIESASNMELGRDYNSLIAKAFNPINHIADANNDEHFKWALEASMEPNTGKQRTPVFQLLYMTDSFSEGRVEEILNYLRNQDKQRQEAIGNYMINVLKRSAKEKNDSELKSQISDLIEQIKKILSEEKSKEGTQKSLGSKPTPKPLP